MAEYFSIMVIVAIIIISFGLLFSMVNTLSKLIIVVVIIGIFAALAIPRFMKASEESQQKQVKNTLQLIYSMEKFHRDLDDDPIINTWVINHTGCVEHTVNDLTE